ncbi:reverse transcriptase domain-containing protein [Tanacetum coccineum]
MLQRCEDTNLCLNWGKSHFMVKEGIVLGHKISKNGIEVDKAKVDVIAKLPHPTTVKGVRSFLSHADFYRRFIKDFSKISRPMTHLLEKNTPFIFSDECIQAFQTLKKKLTEPLILIAPDWDLPFELMCDASDFAIGAILGQHHEKHFRPIHYASKTMNEAESHYTTTEKEMLAVVYAFEKFQSYLILNKSIVYTDHSTLKYLFAKKDSKARLLRFARDSSYVMVTELFGLRCRGMVNGWLQVRMASGMMSVKVHEWCLVCYVWLAAALATTSNSMLSYRFQLFDKADEAQSSRVLIPFSEDPYEAIRQAYLDGTNTESEPFEDLVETETPESPHTVAPPTSLPESTLPTLVPIIRRTAHMAVRIPPAMSPGLSASMAEVAAMSDSAFHKRFRSSYESLPSSSPPDLPSQKRYRGTFKLVEDDEEIEESLGSDSGSEDVEDESPTKEDEDPAMGDEGLATGDEGPGMGVESRDLDDESRGLDDEGHSIESGGLGLGEEEEAIPESQQQAVLVVGEAVSAPLELEYGALRRRELAVEEDHVYSMFEVGQGSGSALKPERPKRVSASRQPTLTTWTGCGWPK